MEEEEEEEVTANKICNIKKHCTKTVNENNKLHQKQIDTKLYVFSSAIEDQEMHSSQNGFIDSVQTGYGV